MFLADVSSDRVQHLRLLVVLIAVVLYATILEAQAPAPNQSDKANTTEAVAFAPLTLGPGDLVHVSILGAPEFERDARASQSGQLPLPMIGEVPVAGLSPADAERTIEKRLIDGGFYVNPQVSILVKEYATQGISVLGEVQKPGVYPLLGSHSLFDAISAAGGTTPRAGEKVTITHRSRPQQPESVILAFSAESSPRSNVSVQPGDTVVVSKAGMVYVIGDVRQPTGIILESPDLTVLKAIAMAQGTNPTAALNKAKLIRKGPKGVEDIPVPLKQILGAKSADLRLQPEDILFVPNSTAKSAFMRTIEAALHTASGVVIYNSRGY